MNKLSRKEITLARHGIVRSYNTQTEEYEIQRIDDPQQYAEDFGLDFIPIRLESDQEAQEVYKHLIK